MTNNHNCANYSKQFSIKLGPFLEEDRLSRLFGHLVDIALVHILNRFAELA